MSAVDWFTAIGSIAWLLVLITKQHAALRRAKPSPLPAFTTNLIGELHNFGLLTVGRCSLIDNGQYFTMDGPDGATHSLLKTATGNARLLAHWQGFTAEYNRSH
jgi:hypothetical protein